MAQETNVIRETDDEAIRLAKTLLRTARYGALAALDPQSGAPLARRVAVATEVSGEPVVLVSALSEHTSAIVADPRCSLLVGEPGRGDPLAHPRLSLICRAQRLERGDPEASEARRRYLNRHPKAQLYVDFADFAFFRLRIVKASLNGGFGKAYRLDRGDIVLVGPAVDQIAAGEQSAIERMNADDGQALALHARNIVGASKSKWRLTAIDPEGIDLDSGSIVKRLFFPTAVGNVGDLRRMLINLAESDRDFA